jgi:2-keto-4-pentenoate hydratase/2-oxohepta-3-ene-1,7-dioic acid hydratase in catechol pathway
MARWIRFTHRGEPGFGTLAGDVVHLHEGDMFAGAQPTGSVLPLAQVVLRCPVQPGKVIALYNNFAASLDKLQQNRPAEPLYLIKAPNTYLDPGAAILPPARNSRVIFEGELGVVIGRRCKEVGEAQAMSHVFGVTCANDVTAADILTRDRSFVQWSRAKGFDGFCPFGPAVATGLDVAGLTVRTFLNGVERQCYPMSDMLFSVAELVSRISHDMTLHPGDLILCGTSLGVGVMKPGSTVEVEIDGIGRLSNRFERPAALQPGHDVALAATH